MVQQVSRKVVTRTESQIRREHPEAQVIPHTRRELLIPETPEEIRQRLQQTDTSKLGSPAPGSAAYLMTVGFQLSASRGLPSNQRPSDPPDLLP